MPDGCDACGISGINEKGTVVYYGPKKFDVARPATLLDFAPAYVDPGLEVLAVRAVFLYHVGPSGHLTGDWPGSVCTDRWPPRGFGESYPISGLRVLPGDTIGMVVFVRPRDPEYVGPLRAEGYRLRFHADGLDQAITVKGATYLRLSYVDERDPSCHDADTWLVPDPRFPA